MNGFAATLEEEAALALSGEILITKP